MIEVSAAPELIEGCGGFGRFDWLEARFQDRQSLQSQSLEEAKPQSPIIVGEKKGSLADSTSKNTKGTKIRLKWHFAQFRVTFGLPQTRLGIVEASFTLHSLLLRFRPLSA